MTDFEKYVFILCLTVFALLTLVFSSMLIIMTKQSVRLIESGADDKRLYKECVKKTKRGKKRTGWLSRAITVFFACMMVCVFGFTISSQIMEKQMASVPVCRVVYSDSMSKKHDKNKYLAENNLNDQFSRFDLIVTNPLPKEEDLKLYDIVVYEVGDTLVVHRIVGIEEPNAEHPDGRLFILQGDFVSSPDRDPVRYEQMRAIYSGKCIKHVGSFVMFLQSPAGYLCLILLILEMAGTPIISKRLMRAENNRIEALREKARKDLRKQAKKQAAIKAAQQIFKA